MTRTSSPFRLLVFVLTLHLAHVPVPVWDAGDAVHPGAVAPLVPPEPCWDVDLLLLGVDPPENSDDGPIDSQPENSDAHLYVSSAGGPRLESMGATAGSPSARCVLRAFPAAALCIVSDSARQHERPDSFSASFEAHDWRELLSVRTI